MRFPESPSPFELRSPQFAVVAAILQKRLPFEVQEIFGVEILPSFNLDYGDLQPHFVARYSQVFREYPEVRRDLDQIIMRMTYATGRVQDLDFSRSGPGRSI